MACLPASTTADHQHPPAVTVRALRVSWVIWVTWIAILSSTFSHCIFCSQTCCIALICLRIVCLFWLETIAISVLFVIFNIHLSTLKYFYCTIRVHVSSWIKRWVNYELYLIDITNNLKEFVFLFFFSWQRVTFVELMLHNWYFC